METTDFTNLDHLTFGASLCSSELRGVFAEGQMSAPAVVIRNIRGEGTTERALSEDDDVIQTLAANGTNEPFDIGPLPGRSPCGKHLFDAHSFYLIDELLPEDSITDRAVDTGARCPRERLPAVAGLSTPRSDGRSPQSARFVGAHAPAPETHTGFRTGSSGQ